jgi:DNA-directed RNA polymerase specialized sigma24 family protein
MDLTNREVAKVLGLTRASVKVLHYRAMKALREHLGADAPHRTGRRQDRRFRPA